MVKLIKNYSGIAILALLFVNPYAALVLFLITIIVFLADAKS